MALKLKWENPNVVATRTTIYRGDAPLNPQSMPSPQVTLDAGVTEWVDDTAKFGQTYYYILGSKTDNDEVFTPNQKILVADNRGVGSSTLLVGDDNLGYFGQVLSADFVNSSHLLAAALTTSGLPSGQSNPTWHKFVRRGKIIYVPNMTFGTTTWVSLYNAGFVFGVDGNGPSWAALAGLTPTNQNRIISFKGNNYRIRLMRGISDKPLTVDMWNAVKGDTESMDSMDDNEINDFFYPLVWPVPMKWQHFENVSDDIPDNYLYSPFSTYNSDQVNAARDAARIICQERHPSAATAAAGIMTRACRSSNYGSSVPYNVSHISAAAVLAGNATSVWFPVLELIEDSVTVNKG